MENEKIRGENRENFEYQRARAKAWLSSKGITIDIEEGDTIIIRQVSSPNGHYRTNRELRDIARFWYPDKRYKIRPVTFCFDAEQVTAEWVQEQMDILGLKPKDLVHQLGLSAPNISLILRNKRNMSTPTKALFFYFFTLYHVNRQLREPDIKPEGIMVVQ